MSIATEISRLQAAKVDLKAAIEGKGVTVPAAAKLDEYPDLVAEISGAANLQSKSVRIAENGTIIVTPDVGYDGMSDVKVVTAVLTPPGETDFLEGEITFESNVYGNGANPNPWVVSNLNFKPYFLALIRKTEVPNPAAGYLGQSVWGARFRNYSSMQTKYQNGNAAVYVNNIITWGDNGFLLGPSVNIPLASGTYYYAIWGEYEWAEEEN